MAEQALFVVTVSDELTPALIGHAGCRYQSPPQDEQQARTLIRVLLDAPYPPAGAGPWRRPLAGGRRHITLSSTPASR